MIHRMDPPEPGEPLPERIEPMKATPAEAAGRRRRWGFEIKWDGVRAIALLRAPATCALESRSRRDVTARFPELSAIALELGGAPAVLDGELVAFDEDGRPSFQRLERRIARSPPTPRSAAAAARRPVDLRRLRPPPPGRERCSSRRTRSGASGSRRSGSTARAGRRPPTTAATAPRCAGERARRASRGSSPSGSGALPPGRRSRDWREVKNVAARRSSSAAGFRARAGARASWGRYWSATTSATAGAPRATRARSARASTPRAALRASGSSPRSDATSGRSSERRRRQ